MKKNLSIDDSGIRGLIPAMVLTEIERRTAQPISKSFDLIAETSTGGILALGLSKADKNGNPEFSAETLSELYKTDSTKIFPQVPGVQPHATFGFGLAFQRKSIPMTA